MPKTSSTAMLLASGAAASTWLSGRAFVAPAPGGAPQQQQLALRGAAPSGAEAAGASAGFGSATSCALLLGAAAAGASRVARRAEPVSASMAAAAAAKAASAAKAATQTGAAVAGAAAAGGMTAGGMEGGIAGKKNPSPSFNPAVQIGVTAPLGYFDPAGFCKKGDENGFRNLRAAEIKHGRVAMMAAVGAALQHYVKFPGFESVPDGLSAVSSPPGSYGMMTLFVVAGSLEIGPWSENADREPGNFGDPAGLDQYNEDMRNRELNNGRMAMFAALGIIGAELLTGKDGIEQLGL